MSVRKFNEFSPCEDYSRVASIYNIVLIGCIHKVNDTIQHRLFKNQDRPLQGIQKDRRQKCEAGRIAQKILIIHTACLSTY